jgi:hypothetical protein
LVVELNVLEGEGKKAGEASQEAGRAIAVPMTKPFGLA